MNFSMKYLFPNLKVRQHCPTSPKSVAPAEMTVHVFDLSSFSFCDKVSKNFCEMTDMLAPVSNSAVVVYC